MLKRKFEFQSGNMNWNGKENLDDNIYFEKYPNFIYMECIKIPLYRNDLLD